MSKKSMHIKFTIIFLLINFGLFSQSKPPIGKWVLSEHVVTKYDSVNQIWIESENVYKHDFEAFIIFDSCHNYIHQIGDTVIYGKWKLKRNGKKLKIKYSDGSKEINYFVETMDYNKPLNLNEFLYKHYNYQNDSDWGGESKYVCVYPVEYKADSMLKKSNNPSIDSNRLIGNWKITHFQKGKHKKIFTSGFYYSIYKDSLNKNEFIRGNWQQYDTTQCSDVLMHKEKWHPRPFKEYKIEI